VTTTQTSGTKTLKRDPVGKIPAAAIRRKAKDSTPIITDTDLVRMNEGQVLRWLMLTWEIAHPDQSAFKVFPAILSCSLQFLSTCVTHTDHIDRQAHLGTDRWITLSSFTNSGIFWRWQELRKSK
jgi:hypothetical protein